MKNISFLLDEHVPSAVANALIGLASGVRVRIVGVHAEVPIKGTTDPDLLVFAEKEKYSLVTFDKETMPSHATSHIAMGRHTWGLFIFPTGMELNAGIVGNELAMIWDCSTIDEWTDQTVCLPL